MPEAILSLEEQFSLPLVQDMVIENDKLRALLKSGTKIPDSQIEDLTVPYVFKNKLLMKEGEYNGVFYPKEEILAEADQADEKGLVYDHLDTAGEGASNWLGQVTNPRWDDSGEDGPGLYGDLKVVDKSCAQLLASGAKWGISPAIDYQKNEVDGQIVGTNLLWKSFSFVLSPAVRETMLNNLKKIKGDVTMAEPKDEKKKLPYKYPAQNQETPEEKKKRMKKEKEEQGELQVDEKTLQILEARDAEISELKEFKDKIELSEKTATVAELIANEYLIGRLQVDELADREKALMEKSSDVLTELADVIGSHAELSKFTDFVKAFIKKHKGATIKDAAKAWKKQKPKANDKKGKGKLAEPPAVDPNMPGNIPGAATDDPSGVEEGEEGEAEDLEEGEGYIDDPLKPADPNTAAGQAAMAAQAAAKANGAAALTGADNADPGRALAQLNASGMTPDDTDAQMLAWFRGGAE